MDDPRLQPLWHPRVHAHFGENLVLWGVEVEHLDKALTFLEEADEDISAYLVFGQKDLLLRFYATADEQERIRGLVERAVGRITGDLTVDASDIHFIWGRQVGECREGNIQGWVREQYLAAATDWESTPDEQRREMRRAGVVLDEFTNPVGDENIRVFIALKCGLASGPDAIELLIEELRGRSMITDYLFSLYHGKSVGFEGNIVIELAVPNPEFERVIEVIKEIHKAFKVLRPKTQTYIAVNISHERVPRCRCEPTWKDLVDACIERFPAVSTLGVLDQVPIVTLFHKWRGYLGTQAIGVLAHGMVDAMIVYTLSSRSTDAFREEVLSVSAQLEKPLSSFFRRTATASWGESDWQTALEEHINLGKPFDEWSLGELVDAVRRWRDKIGEDLFPPASIFAMRSFVELRNAAAHARRGRDKPQFGDYSVEEILAIVGDIFPVIINLTAEGTADALPKRN